MILLENFFNCYDNLRNKLNKIFSEIKMILK